MIQLSDLAKTQIDEFFKETPPSPIRIFLNSGGCGGPSLAMALDEAGSTDRTIEVKGHKFVVDNDFIQQAQPIKIDFNGMGFVLDSSLDLSQFGGGGCSGCCSGGSCG